MRSYGQTPLAPHSIRVNSVHPTGVRTPMVVQLRLMQQFPGGPDPAMGQAMANALAGGHGGAGGQSPTAILWLVSDDGALMSPGINGGPSTAGFTKQGSEGARP